jgi:hypothetical protein
VDRRALVLLLLLGACRPDAGDTAQSSAAARRLAHGPVVARVGAAELGLHDVEQAVHETGLAPDKALDRLVAEQLLGQRAEERGYGSGAGLDRELKKARARALLEQAVERDITPEGVPAAQVAERFAKLKASLDRPEARSVTVLSFPRSKGGPAPLLNEVDAKAAMARLLGLPPEAQEEQLATLRDEAAERGQTLKLDQLLVPLTGGGVDPTLQSAVAALTRPGLVPQVVETRRASLLVVAGELVPAHEASFAEHEAAIRAQLANEARVERTKALLDELTAHARIRYDEEAIQRALADDSLLGNLP